MKKKTIITAVMLLGLLWQLTAQTKAGDSARLGKANTKDHSSSNLSGIVRVVVLDAIQRSVVPQASLRITNKAGQPILVNLGDKKSEWAFEWIEDEVYTAHVSAADYVPFRGTLQKPEANAENDHNLMYLEIKRVPAQQAVLTAHDATSNKPIAATFKLTSLSYSTQNSQTTLQKPDWKTKLSSGEYLIEINAQNYKTYFGSFTADETYLADTTKKVFLLDSAQPFSYLFIYRAVNSKDKSVVLNAKFQFTDAKTKQFVPFRRNPSTGENVVEFLPKGDYIIAVEAEGFEPITQTFGLAFQTAKPEIKTDIPLTPLPSYEPPKKEVTPTSSPKNVVAKGIVSTKKDAKKKENPKPSATDVSKMAIGTTVQLDNVYFDQSSYVLRPESHQQLDKLATSLKTNPRIKIEIAGHTDDVGDPRLNLLLSENRAKVITNYLTTSKGVTERQITYKGYGQTKPVAPNDNETNKSKNRRVEFIIISN